MMQPRKPMRRFTGLVGLPPEPDTPKHVQNPTLANAVVSEDELRDWFGVEERDTRPKLPESYRQFFGLEPEDLMGFFDKEIGSYSDLAHVDFIVSPEMIQHRLRRLQKIINRAKEIIEGLDVRVMKIRRGKENVLDKPTREKFKCEEQARLARCYAKRAKYYATAKQPACTEKVWRIVTKPIYLRDVVDDHMSFTTVTDTKWIENENTWGADGSPYLNYTGWIEILNRGYFDLDGYKAVMKLDSAALQELGEAHEEMQHAWRNLIRWENTVIAAAIAYHIVQPRYDLAKFLRLDQVVVDLNSQVAMEDFDQRDFKAGELELLQGKDSDAANKPYAGRLRIQSAGFRYRANSKPVPRALSSFDRPTKMDRKREVKYPVSE